MFSLAADLTLLSPLLCHLGHLSIGVLFWPSTLLVLCLLLIQCLLLKTPHGASLPSSIQPAFFLDMAGVPSCCPRRERGSITDTLCVKVSIGIYRHCHLQGLLQQKDCECYCYCNVMYRHVHSIHTSHPFSASCHYLLPVAAFSVTISCNSS